jgi:hypothetical protein
MKRKPGRLNLRVPVEEAACHDAGREFHARGGIMLIVSLDRWPGGAVRIAWRGAEEGVQVLMAEPGQGLPFFGRADAARVPYVVRDIAETVRLSGVRSRQVCAAAAPGAAGLEAQGAVAGRGGWWEAARQAATWPERGPDEAPGAEHWVAPPPPRALARFRGWVSRVFRGPA